MKTINELEKVRILVGMGTCGIAAGADLIYRSLKEEIEKNRLTNINLVKTGCIGLCYLEPIIEVLLPAEEKITYIKMTPEKAIKVIKDHVIAKQIVTQFTYQPATAMISDQNISSKQYRIALRNCGVINPEDVDEYLACDGYKAVTKVLTEMIPAEVINMIKESDLRGRGGGGFPTGLKWEFAAKQDNTDKYIICNADEGDPGAFMDRAVLEGDPHSVIEAMIIGGYAIGAHQGFIYVRAEYPVAVERLSIAIEQAQAYGFLGDNILGSGFNFNLEIRLGAGAFVCGEETALMNSIEGKRGIPRPKPPFPAASGLFGKPTVINNVETFANIPSIILRGADWFTGIGTEKSKGTKVFALGGKIKNTGLAEVPMGITLREIIYDIGGGITDDKKFKAVQTGGPSGGCITALNLDTSIDYDNLTRLGSMMGSGGMIVMDEDNCMVDVARFYLDFIKDESCGKCTPCRIGTTRLLEILNKITEGKGTIEDLDKLQLLAEQIKAASLCGLGQTAPNPVLSTLKYFWDEYRAHVIDKKCPAGVCKALLKYAINQDKCKGCGLCSKHCPVDAISGNLKEVHFIDINKCIKCGSCIEVCHFNAVEIS